MDRELRDVWDDVASDAADVESVVDKPGDDSTNEDDKSTNLRTLYWAAVHEAQKRIKREFPDLSGREVLKRARAERLGCIYLLKSIFEKVLRRSTNFDVVGSSFH